MATSLTVFVCGTYSDLTKERDGVLDAVRRLRLQHDSMELFGARPDRPIETCLNEVRQSDVLVVIVGHLYGSIAPEMNISFTEAEYTEGYRLNKPCLVYIRDEDVPILPRFMEHDPDKILLLRKFKEILRSHHTVATFRYANDLAVAVATDLSRITQELKTAAIQSFEQHLAILKRGIDAWNAWRLKNPDTKPNLEGADLSRMDLSSADFSDALLTNANLSETILVRTNFSGVSLTRVDFRGALLGETMFCNTDLSEANNLDSIVHQGPSSIGIDSLYKSNGKIPEVFLRRCGIPEDFIHFIRSFTAKPIEFYSCFISYSANDEHFVRRLYNDLRSEGVRCWLAPEDLRIGERFHVRIDESIRLFDKLLVVLSKNSVSSQWVEKEVETAFEKEREQKNTVLFPVRLDDAVLAAKTGWAADIRKSRHVGDFREWKNHDSYRKAFERLMRDLKAEAGR
jgi:hypothetical protein